MISTFIVDDELFAREELKHLLSVYPDFKLVGEADNGIEAIKKIREIKPSLIFLDIEMPGLKGLEIASILSTIPFYKPYIIIVTAYDNYAVNAFEYDVLDYILKPIEPKRFSVSVSKILKLNNATVKLDKISVKKGSKVVLIPIEDISYIYLNEAIVFINSNGFSYSTTYRTLDEVEKYLGYNNFFRTHRTYIVNLQKVKEIKQLSSGLLALKINGVDDQDIPVSRNKSKEIKNIFKL